MALVLGKLYCGCHDNSVQVSDFSHPTLTDKQHNPNKNLILIDIETLIEQFSLFQEIDLATGTFSTIQSGSRKLLGKPNPVHSLQVYNGLVYAASSSLDGATVKVQVSFWIVSLNNPSHHIMNSVSELCFYIQKQVFFNIL